MKNLKLQKQEIIRFLKKNGFKYMERNSYANDYCGVCFTDEGITVVNNEGDEWFLTDAFGMVGCLTWFGFINKNYKQ